MPSLLTTKCKTRGTLSYPTHKVFVKVSKRSVVRMASKLTSRVAEPSKTPWSPPGKGSNSPPATAHLPSGEGSSSSQAIAHLPSREGNNVSQATALFPPSEGSSIPQATSSPQAGQFSNPTRSVRQGHRCSPRHRAPQSSQENSTISWEDNSTPPPSRPPQHSSNEEPNPK